MTSDELTPPSSSSSRIPITIGVLALQGAFSEHLSLLSTLLPSLPRTHTYRFLPIRDTPSLLSCDALIIPGGESTTISLIASRSQLLNPLRSFIHDHHRPVWGTCAGLILLAEELEEGGVKQGGQEGLGGLGVRVRRNAWGRQQESFVGGVEMRGEWAELGEEFRGVFIRAPVVEVVGVGGEDGDKGKGKVEVLGVVEQGGERRVVAVKQENVVGCSFHPELTRDGRLHLWWVGEVVKDVERREREERGEVGDGDGKR